MKKYALLIIPFMILFITTYFFLVSFDHWFDFESHKMKIGEFEKNGFSFFNDTNYPVSFHYMIYLLSNIVDINILLAFISSACLFLFIFSIYRYISIRFDKKRGDLSVVIILSFTLVLYFHFVGAFPFLFAMGCFFLALPHIEKNGIIHWIPITLFVLAFLTHRLVFTLFVVYLIFYEIRQKSLLKTFIPSATILFMLLLFPSGYFYYGAFNSLVINPYRFILFLVVFFIFNLFVVRGCLKQWREKRLDFFFLIAFVGCGLFELFTPFFFTRFHLGYIIFGIPFMMENIDLLENNLNGYTYFLLGLPISFTWGFMINKIYFTFMV